MEMMESANTSDANTSNKITRTDSMNHEAAQVGEFKIPIRGRSVIIGNHTESTESSEHEEAMRLKFLLIKVLDASKENTSMTEIYNRDVLTQQVVHKYVALSNTNATQVTDTFTDEEASEVLQIKEILAMLDNTMCEWDSERGHFNSVPLGLKLEKEWKDGANPSITIQKLFDFTVDVMAYSQLREILFKIFTQSDLASNSSVESSPESLCEQDFEEKLDIQQVVVVIKDYLTEYDDERGDLDSAEIIAKLSEDPDGSARSSSLFLTGLITVQDTFTIIKHVRSAKAAALATSINASLTDAKKKQEEQEKVIATLQASLVTLTSNFEKRPASAPYEMADELEGSTMLEASYDQSEAVDLDADMDEKLNEHKEKVDRLKSEMGHEFDDNNQLLSDHQRKLDLLQNTLPELDKQKARLAEQEANIAKVKQNVEPKMLENDAQIAKQQEEIAILMAGITQLTQALNLPPPTLNLQSTETETETETATERETSDLPPTPVHVQPSRERTHTARLDESSRPNSRPGSRRSSRERSDTAHERPTPRTRSGTLRLDSKEGEAALKQQKKISKYAAMRRNSDDNQEELDAPDISHLMSGSGNSDTYLDLSSNKGSKGYVDVAKLMKDRESESVDVNKSVKDRKSGYIDVNKLMKDRNQPDVAESKLDEETGYVDLKSLMSDRVQAKPPADDVLSDLPSIPSKKNSKGKRSKQKNPKCEWVASGGRKCSKVRSQGTDFCANHICTNCMEKGKSSTDSQCAHCAGNMSKPGRQDTTDSALEMLGQLSASLNVGDLRMVSDV